MGPEMGPWAPDRCPSGATLGVGRGHGSQVSPTSADSGPAGKFSKKMRIVGGLAVGRQLGKDPFPCFSIMEISKHGKHRWGGRRGPGRGHTGLSGKEARGWKEPERS